MIPMPLRLLKTKTVTAATGALLDTAFATWIDDHAGQKTVVDMFFDFDGASFALVIVYTEG